MAKPKLLIALEQLNVYRHEEYDDYIIIRKSKLANTENLINTVSELIRIMSKEKRRQEL